MVEEEEVVVVCFQDRMEVEYTPVEVDLELEECIQGQGVVEQELVVELEPVVEQE